MDTKDMDFIRDLCVFNYIEIQHLKKLLCEHFNIDDRIGKYDANLEGYLNEMEQKDIILMKELEARRKKRARQP